MILHFMNFSEKAYTMLPSGNGMVNFQLLYPTLKVKPSYLQEQPAAVNEMRCLIAHLDER